MQDRQVSVHGIVEVREGDVLVHRVGQVLPGGAEAEGGDARLARVVAAVGAEAVAGDLRRQAPMEKSPTTEFSPTMAFSTVTFLPTTALGKMMLSFTTAPFSMRAPEKMTESVTVPSTTAPSDTRELVTWAVRLM